MVGQTRVSSLRSIRVVHKLGRQLCEDALSFQGGWAPGSERFVMFPAAREWLERASSRLDHRLMTTVQDGPINGPAGRPR